MADKDQKLTRVIPRNLADSRTNEKIPVSANGWVVEQIEGPATLRVQSKAGYPYPLRKFRNNKLPQQYDKFFLSNEATSGKLVIHFLRKGGLQPLPGGNKGGLPIKATIERGLDLTQDHQITLDTSSFGRPQVEIIAITYDSSGDYPGSSVDFKLYASPDKVKWYQVDSYTGDRWTGNGMDNALRYIMLESKGGGLADETCDLILSSTE